MLKPLKPSKPNNLFIWIAVGVLILAGIITLIISFSNANAEEDAIIAAQTNAAETVAAQQLTLQAASPTMTPTLETPTPSLTPTLFVTNTLPVLVSPTTSTGGTGGGSGAVGCDNSVFVSDVTIPDKTAMTPGQTFTKTWRLQNNGTCPWTTSYSVTFLSGSQMNGAATPLTVAVQPGQSGDVSVNLVAPSTAGTALGYWRLSNASGIQFGTSFYVEIVVGASGATATTGVATATTGAPASTATFTPEPTATTETPDD
ncbi:MAG TPA: hypothetical protein DIW23_02580 [Anaerolineae bacterium]|nr:hypothetical protein [Anaerolineae bacterium]HRJ75962.1 NBR1-Ig-like domain-containing protein [Anaerolineales bacterium]